MDDKLPIDVDLTTKPLTFRWRQRVDGINGIVIQDCSGPIPSVIEMQVASVIEMAKRLQRENKELRGQIDSLTRRPVTQPPATQTAKKKG